MDKINIGVVTKPQALKGEFRLKPFLNNLNGYKKINEVYIDETLYKVENVILRDTFVIFKLFNLNTIEQAENFRNKNVYAFIDLEKTSNYRFLNFNVFVDEEKIGVINEINNFGSKDIFTIDGYSNIMLPVVDGLILKVDELDKSIYLNKEIFKQVVVYED